MIRLTKRNEINDRYKGVCFNCKSEYDAKKSDLEFTFIRNEHSIQATKCDVCKSSVYWKKHIAPINKGG